VPSTSTLVKPRSILPTALVGVTLAALAAGALAAVWLLPGEERAAELSWAPPALDNPRTVRITRQRRDITLDPRRDYRLELPRRPLRAAGGVTIAGGRNVVLIGGTIAIPRQPRDADPKLRRALLLKGQTGTLHVEGVRLAGPDIGEGINLDQRRGATVQLQNIRVDTIRARDERHFSDTHPDLIQSYAGPRRLRIDGFTGTSDYQGFFLHPRQFAPNLRIGRWVLRRINLRATATAGYLLWRVGRFPVELDDVWVAPNPRKGLAQTLQPPGGWRRVETGRPPGGDFVGPGDAGVGYVSPGYHGS
jgi:hypothetical protein